jgi:hypothetical protein
MTRRSSWTPRLILTALTALMCCSALAIAGCGSSSKSSSKTATTTSTPTTGATTASTTSTSTTAATTASTTTSPATKTGTGTTSSLSSTSDAAYGEFVLAQNATFQAAATKYQTANKMGSLSVLSSSSAVFGTAAAKFAKALGSRPVPSKIAAPIGTLTSALRSLASDLDKISTDAKHNDVAALKTDSADVQSILPKLEQAESQLSAEAK